jgi:hypothetical protein
VEQVRNAQFQAEIAPRRDVHLRLHHDRVGRFVEVLCARARACAYACARVRACACASARGAHLYLDSVRHVCAVQRVLRDVPAAEDY